MSTKRERIELSSSLTGCGRFIRDKEQFERLVKQERTAVTVFIYRGFSGNSWFDLEKAEEIVNEAAVRMWRAEMQSIGFKGESSFRTWFVRIAINIAINETRRMNNLPTIQNLDELRKLAHEPPARPERVELGPNYVQQAISLLPEFWQEHAQALADPADFSYEELAEMFNVPIGTVRSRGNRVRAMLRPILKKLVNDDLTLLYEKDLEI